MHSNRHLVYRSMNDKKNEKSLEEKLEEIIVKKSNESIALKKLLENLEEQEVENLKSNNKNHLNSK